MVCILLYVGFSHSLLHEIDGFLGGEVHEMAALLSQHANDPQAVQGSFEGELGARERHALLFRLKDEQGQVLVSSDAAARTWVVRMPPAGWQVHLGTTHFETIEVPEFAHPVRVCSQAFRAADGRLYVAEAAYALDRMQASLGIFRTVAVIALFVAGVAALLGGALYAERSLRPVQAIIRKAERMGMDELEARLPLRGSGDELDRLAETLNGLLARIEGHVRRLRQFTADASHELRSPLAVLRGNAEVVLARSRSAEELRNVIEQSMDHYDRLTRIADDLLLLAKADAGRISFEREEVSLDEAVRDVVDLYGPLAEERGIALDVRAMEPTVVVGDRTYLRQLVGNVVDNAIKYIGGGTEVQVSLSASNGAAIVVVEDDGPGIATKHLPHVFDRFYRVDQARSGSGPRGSGLGLPICQMIATAHGGAVEIADRDGGGARVTIRLPLVAA